MAYVEAGAHVTLCSLPEAKAAIDVGLNFDLDTTRGEVPLKSSMATSNIWKQKTLAGRIDGSTNRHRWVLRHPRVLRVPKRRWIRAIVNVCSGETMDKYIYTSCVAQGL